MNQRPIDAMDDLLSGEAVPDALEAESAHRVCSSPAIEEPIESFLALYFKEMAALSILRPEEEFEAARNIELLELELWSHLLSHVDLIEALLALVERGLENSLEEFATLRSSARALRRRPSAKGREEYSRRRAQAACSIYALDLDRRLLLAVLAELRHVARGERTQIARQPLRINVSSKSFRQYCQRAWALFSRAQRARNDFVKANLRLVVSIARRFNYGRMPLNDLIQEGNIGLIKAVERYDYRRGYRFSTYASWWIRHAISRALADKGRAVRLPVHMLDAYHKVAKTTRELSTRLGRAPTAEEIGSSTGLGAEKVERIQGHLLDYSLSLDRGLSDDDDRRFVEMLQDPEAPLPSDRLMEEAISGQVREVMDELKPIEIDVLRKRFGLNGGRELTLKEIGACHSLSRERIRQIQEQALLKIRRALELRDVI